MKTKFLPILLVAVALLAACKGKSYKSSADSAKVADSVTMANKLVKTADISFKVKDVKQTGEAISALTDKFDGMVMHHQMQSSINKVENIHLSNDSMMLISAFNTTAEMTVKIPSDKLENFVNQVNRMGIYISSSKMDIEDRSLDYLSSKLKADNRKELVKEQKSGKITLKHPDEILTVKDDMVDKQISNLKTDEQVMYSTINLNFYQNDTILKEVMANSDPSAYNIPMFQRLGLALGNGWAIFMDMLVGMLNLWVFILAAIGVWMGYRYYKNRVRITNQPTV
ncbi:MAG TPA: DUF4349 domain-containing protein [Mucilaginibacter sp.]|nr:DUF4349 domain-containing protein [Mucilaginibacter sp.]